MVPDLWGSILYYKWQWRWINIPLSQFLPPCETIPFQIQKSITFQDIKKNGLSLKYCLSPRDISSILYIMNSIDNIEVIDDEKVINILKKILKNGYTLGDIMMSGYSPDKIKSLYSCEALLNHGVLLINIEKVGYTLREMKNAFMNIENEAYIQKDVKKTKKFSSQNFLKKLRDANYSCTQVLDLDYTFEEVYLIGYTFDEIRNSGISLNEMKKLEPDAKEYKEAKYSCKEVINIEKYSWDIIFKAGYTLAEAEAAGYMFGWLHRANNYGISCSQALEMTNQIISCKDFRLAGYSCSDLKTANYSLNCIKDAGYSLLEMKDGGFSCTEFKDAGYSLMDILYAEYSMQEIKEAGYSLEKIREAGYALEKIREAYTIDEIKEFKYTLEEIKGAGYTLDEIKNEGYNLQKIKEAGYTLHQIKNEGYTLYDIKEVGYTQHEIINAGYSLDDIKEEGYTLEKRFKK